MKGSRSFLYNLGAEEMSQEFSAPQALVHTETHIHIHNFKKITIKVKKPNL